MKAWWADRRLRIVTLLVAAFFVLVGVMLPASGFWFDQDSFIRWALLARAYGIGGIYGVPSDLNYPPLSLYGLRLAAAMWPNAEALWSHTAQMKLLPLAFDAASVALALWALRHEGRSPFWVLALVLNPAFLYVTVFWGQIDALTSFFGIAGFLAAFAGAPVLVGIALGLAVTTKLQAIVLFPAIGLILLLRARDRARMIVQAIGAGLFTVLLIILPTLLAGTFPELLRVVLGATSTFPVASMNAFNIWHLLLVGNPMTIPDTMLLGGVSLRWAGLALFALNLTFILTILVRKRARTLATFSLAMGLSIVAFFLFPTQMHERYVVPALVFLALHAMLTNAWGAYGLISLATLLNLEAVLRAFPSFDATFPFLLDPTLLAILMIVGYVTGLVMLTRATGGARSGRTSPPARRARRRVASRGGGGASRTRRPSRA